MKPIAAAVCGMAAAMLFASPALADKGLGQYYNQKYEAHGISATHVSDDGAVAVDAQDIETVNCGGCDTVWYGPGIIFHFRNTSKNPICAAFVFDRQDTNDYEIDTWGSGAIYYLKGRQSVPKIGGLYMLSTGGSRSVNLGYNYSIHTWDPIGKKNCGADPYA